MSTEARQPRVEGGASSDGEPAPSPSDLALADTITSAGSEPGDSPGRAAIAERAAAGARSPGFAPGEVIAGRYQIIRFIAQGGMGEVYEASDLELRSRVALKTVRTGRVSERAVERLK